MEKIKKFARLLKYTLKGVTKEFDSATLPWIDKADDKAITDYVSKHDFGDFPYDMEEKLKFWRKNGYVILEKAIPVEWIDKLQADFDTFLDNPENFQTSVLVEAENWDKEKNQEARNVPTNVLRGKGIKVNDFYNTSSIGKKIMLYPAVMTFLKTVFDKTPVAMQSLNFTFGSQQPAHMDFPYVVSGIPSHLAAAWIAMEDVKPDSGPLFYFVGSHKMKKFNWGNGILYHVRESYYTPVQFAEWLERNCKKNGYKREVLLINKGDVLIWHAALVHGGTVIENPEQTRKSYVCHYSTPEAYPVHRFKPNEKPTIVEYGGGVCYEHPFLKQEENYFKD